VDTKKFLNQQENQDSNHLSHRLIPIQILYPKKDIQYKYILKEYKLEDRNMILKKKKMIT